MPGENVTTQFFAPVEIAAGLRPARVDRAEIRGGIERDTRAVTTLLEAARAVMLDYERFRHHVTRPQFHHQMAATAAAGARGKVGRKIGDRSPRQVGRERAIFGWPTAKIRMEFERMGAPEGQCR